jgi:hypothetical protein
MSETLDTELLHPAAGEIDPPAGGGPAKRVADMRGLNVAFFSNNKPNVDLLYDELCRLIAYAGDSADIVRVTKLSSAFPAAKEDVEEVTTDSQLVVNGTGD